MMCICRSYLCQAMNFFNAPHTRETYVQFIFTQCKYISDQHHVGRQSRDTVDLQLLTEINTDCNKRHLKIKKKNRNTSSD